MEVKGKILAKKGDNKAFKLSDDNWYNVNAPVIPYLEKISKGDEVIVTFEKKSTTRYVSKIVKTSEVKAETSKEEAKTSSTGFACEVCGKELKDDKYKTCYICAKKGATKTKETKTYTKTSYDNPDRTAQIQRGNALNAAAAVASSQQFADPETAAQFTKMLADEFLEWLRAE